MRNTVGLVLFFLAIAFSSDAQSLKGKVLSADTHQSVAGANVFLSNTSVGTITNANGEFMIARFPPGRYDLVVSFIGYETYRVELISAQLPDQLEVLLKPKINELQEVVVEAYEKDGWEKWGKIFNENFIGIASFAQDCKLINPEAVHFKLDKKRNTVKASGDEPLIIENHALGYILKYNLTKFEYNIDTREFLFQGYPFFEEMQTDRRGLSRRWAENRELAYYGSIMHFMRSLYRNKLIEQDFDIRQMLEISEAERKRVKAVYEQIPKEVFARMKRTAVLTNGVEKPAPEDSAARMNPDSLIYYETVVKQANAKWIIMPALLNADSIAYGIDSFTVGLSFPQRLQITYKSKTNPFAYQRLVSRSSGFLPGNSQIYLIRGKPLTVLGNGSYFDGGELMILGFWAWSEKMCTRLPYEYWPPPKTIK